MTRKLVGGASEESAVEVAISEDLVSLMPVSDTVELKVFVTDKPMDRVLLAGSTHAIVAMCEAMVIKESL